MILLLPAYGFHLALPLQHQSLVITAIPQVQTQHAPSRQPFLVAYQQADERLGNNYYTNP